MIPFNKKFDIEKLGDNKLLVTSLKTKNKWFVRITKKETTLMQTTGIKVDTSMYNIYGKPGHTLYEFYYNTDLEFSGHKLDIHGKRVYHSYREGDYYENEHFAPDEKDGFAFNGQNTLEIGGSPIKKLNPQLDWYVYRKGWIMYDNRLEGTIEFRKRTGDKMECLEDIDPDDCSDSEDDNYIHELKEKARKMPSDPFLLLPEDIREEARKVLEISEKELSSKFTSSTSSANINKRVRLL